VHFGLINRSRLRQASFLVDFVQQEIPAHAPLIIAGDFNDWRQRTSSYLAEELGLKEVFESHHGRHARSFPAALPFLSLDRIYVRGFSIASAQVLHGQRWRRLSDHAALTAQLRPLA
jgi:endonuclease/exonuclease/phosphatase family metal-dependent hydrolase